SVSRPTGTVIGPPESITSTPRARPSVVSIATARTRSSPRCCWTSQTRTSATPTEISSSSAIAAVRLMWRAWLISGSRSGNTASMTTPWISSIRPVFSFVLASIGLPLLDQRLGAGNDFHYFLGDLRLPGSVHLERQVLDQLARVLGRVTHRCHPCAMLGGGRLEQSS